MIAEVWRRGLWWHKQGLSLEAAREMYTDREMWQAETYWRIEATVNSSGNTASAQVDATEAAFQAMRAKKKRRQ